MYKIFPRQKTWKFWFFKFTYEYDDLVFEPLTEPSKIVSTENQKEITKVIKNGVADNEEKHDREVRLSAS